MSRSVNKAIIIGNLGSDPEIRTTPSGTRVTTFSVATNRRWQNRSGELQEETQWHRVVAWERLAEIAEQYLKKGNRVYETQKAPTYGGEEYDDFPAESLEEGDDLPF